MLRAPGIRGWAVVRSLGLAAVALATLAQACPVVAQSTDLKWRRTPAAMPAPVQYSPAQSSAPRAGGVAAPVLAPQPTPAAVQPASAVVALPPRKLTAGQEPRRLPMD